MSHARMSFASGRAMAGLSLIEMMIALVMALIVAAGIITVFQSTSSSNRVQSQLATLQEEGRFAIHSLRGDVANANGSYCSNSGGNAGLTGSGLYLDALRSPIVYSSDATANTTAISDNTVAMAKPTQAFVLPSNLYTRGYECSATQCLPDDPTTLVPQIPKMGMALGERVIGADVLTIRFIRPGSGWAIQSGGSTSGSVITPVSANSSLIKSIALKQLPGEDPVTDFKDGDLAMLATCSFAGVYSVTDAGNTLAPTGANYAQPVDISQGNPAAPRVFDFTRDFQTVTYYLQVVDAGNGHTTGELMRRVNGGKTNGGSTQPLVRGVERLDFRYGIIDAKGNTRFLDANEVDTAVDSKGNSIPCPPQTPSLSGITPDEATGCLWRAVQTVQVNILMDGQTPLYTLTPQEMNYIYSPDGDAVPVAPAAHTITPAVQGFPNHLLRREFTTVVTLRNFNP